jgi:hypothetical protein
MTERVVHPDAGVVDQKSSFPIRCPRTGRLADLAGLGEVGGPMMLLPRLVEVVQDLLGRLFLLAVLDQHRRADACAKARAAAAPIPAAAAGDQHVQTGEVDHPASTISAILAAADARRRHARRRPVAAAP